MDWKLKSKRLIFKRRDLIFEVAKEEVIRVINIFEAFEIKPSDFLVRLIDGQPTFVIEPSKIVNCISDQLSFGPWKNPSYLLLMRRDGDVCKALMVDSMDWHLKTKDS